MRNKPGLICSPVFKLRVSGCLFSSQSSVAWSEFDFEFILFVGWLAGFCFVCFSVFSSFYPLYKLIL